MSTAENLTIRLHFDAQPVIDAVESMLQVLKAIQPEPEQDAEQDAAPDAEPDTEKVDGAVLGYALAVNTPAFGARWPAFITSGTKLYTIDEAERLINSTMYANSRVVEVREVVR